MLVTSVFGLGPMRSRKTTAVFGLTQPLLDLGVTPETDQVMEVACCEDLTAGKAGRAGKVSPIGKQTTDAFNALDCLEAALKELED